MKKLIAALFVAVAIGAAAQNASAAGGCSGPYCGGSPPPTYGPFSWLFEKKPVPTFQAAPWYLYWPYHAHFMTPAPMGGAYYGPPAAGAAVNPYFPAQPAYYPAPTPMAAP
jgi:hypothetical protein